MIAARRTSHGARGSEGVSAAPGIPRQETGHRDSVNDLYAAADALDAEADASWTLPIYGGRPVAHGADADTFDPPLMLLDPPGVSQAAGFLASVAFDELWHAAGAGFSGYGGDEAQVGQEFFDHHRGLQGFYARAAAAGHAVVKAVWA
ncbi:hypothetical protein CG747_22025 [Streptomyces sp. CB02959]|nr:hypothetical protein CG747_22025 [Streptomyces sp. CB02959]